MKAYVFNSTEEWTTDISRVILAESKEKAMELFGGAEAECEEYELAEGLTFIAGGYDNTSIYVDLP